MFLTGADFYKRKSCIRKGLDIISKACYNKMYHYLTGRNGIYCQIQDEQC